MSQTINIQTYVPMFKILGKPEKQVVYKELISGSPCEMKLCLGQSDYPSDKKDNIFMLEIKPEKGFSPVNCAKVAKRLAELFCNENGYKIKTEHCHWPTLQYTVIKN
ncbi:MAG: hypothetical protein OEX08_00445 [Candidatus Nomurabacteria bacterium]|nr:hypothetical protein [Candidatus Nomurabacteria bacterium]